MGCFTLPVVPPTMLLPRYTYKFMNVTEWISVTPCLILIMFLFLYQVLNDKGYDGTASDVWSCGVILFVLMAGYLPFDEPNLMELYKKVSLSRCCILFFAYNESHLTHNRVHMWISDLQGWLHMSIIFFSWCKETDQAYSWS